MTIKKHTQFILILGCLALVVVNQNTLEQFKASMETKVKDLANQMSTIYGELCKSPVGKSCEIKSYNSCEGTDQKRCYEDFPKPEGCLSDGAMLSNTSTISFHQDTNPDNLDSQDKLFVCTSALLQNKFVEIGEQRNQKFSFEYIGTKTGALRLYPGFKETDGNRCSDFDPRVRPWYVTATSGSKNVILILDTSGSMQNNRLSIAKEAAKRVISTLSNNDFVGVVTFANSAQIIYDSNLNRANSTVKEILIEKVQSLGANGQTNYKQAFEKGFELLKNTISDQFGSPCSDSENIFLFLTDGEPTVPETHVDAESIKQVINDLKEDLNPRIFTYGLGSGIDTAILKSISCQFSGIMLTISDSQIQELPEKMENYYTFIAEGVTIQQPVWTQPYDDAFGFGRLVSASYPIYYNDKNENDNAVRTILGVASIDIVVSAFEEFGLTEENQIVKKLIKNLPCHKSSLNECGLENLREGESKCNNEACEPFSPIECSFEVSTNQFFHIPIDTDENKCCGVTVGALVGIIIGSVVALGIIVAVTVCCCIKKKGKQPNQAVEDPNKRQGEGHPQSAQNINKGFQINNQNPNYAQHQNPYINTASQIPYGHPDPYIP